MSSESAESSKLEVAVDRDLCIGSGNCVYGAPGTFALDDDEVAYVLDPGASPEDAIVQAARRCPSRAISVRRDGASLV